MHFTEIERKCYSITVDEEPKYKIEFTSVEAGELPNYQIFVYTIGDLNDVSTDVFLSVANMEQITKLPVDRNVAIRDAGSHYLSSYVEFTYATLDTAVAAKDVLTSRINELINIWVKYRDDFSDLDGTSIYLPTVDPSYEQKLKDSYTEKKEATINAQLDATEAAALVKTRKAELDSANALRIVYAECKQICETVVGISGTNLSHYIDLVIAGSEPAEAEAYREATLTEAISTACKLTASKYTSSVAAVSNAEAEYTDAVTDSARAATELKEKQREEDEALAAASAACQDFDPQG